MNDTVKILDVNITTLSQEQILEKIIKYIKTSDSKTNASLDQHKEPLVIYTPNPEIISYATKEESFKKIVNKGQINIPDGAGIVWAAKRLEYPITKRIAGVDLSYNIVKLASENSATIGLIGAKDKIALKALECLKKDFPRLNGWAQSGPDIKVVKNLGNLRLDLGSWSIDQFIVMAKQKKTKILLVAFGFPKQELFIDLLTKKLQDTVIMSVGGTLDYWAGELRRAPAFYRDNNLEWFYRLVQQPGRIKRHLKASTFFIKVYTNK